MQIHNLLALNQRQLQTVRDSPRLTATEYRLLVESRCQLSVVVGNSTHSESLVLHYS